MVLIYSYSYMSHDKNKISFCWIVLIFVLSIILLIIIPNAFILILGWDGLGLVSYILVIFYQRTNSFNSGIITIISNRIGDVMIIIIIIFVLNFGTFDLRRIGNLEFICELFIIIAGLTKRAQIPFSAWLPAAIAAPTPVSSLVHSSTLVTAGVYLLIRFDFLFQIKFISEILLKISLFTMLISGINAFFENDLKKIIAFSTLSQLSIIIVILSINLTNLAFFHLIIHAVFKSILFLGGGFVIHNLIGKQDIRILSDFFSFRPLVLRCILISFYSLIGIPFIGGFYSKDLILEYFLLKNLNFILLIIFIFGVIFTFLYNIRLIYYIFFKGILSNILVKINYDIFMKFPIFFLTFLLIIVGNLLFWLIIPYYRLIFITNLQKLLRLILITIVICIRIYFIKINYLSPQNFEFFMTIWFLSKLTRLITLFNNKNFLLISINDWTWVEIIGPIGIKSILTKNYKISFIIKRLSFSKIIVLTILFILLII